MIITKLVSTNMYPNYMSLSYGFVYFAKKLK